MVCFDIPISVDQHIDMAKSMNSTDPYLKLKQINQFHKNKRTSSPPNHLNIPACEQSRYAVIDVVILIAVIGACGFLLYPYARVLAHKTIELGEEVVEVDSASCFAAMALVGDHGLYGIDVGNRAAVGLTNAAEFDIQLETEESVKKSTCVSRNALKKGLFELPRDHHRELEAELKKMAPPNGRAVLVFRARCGCSVGRMEVLGPRKSRKVKK
ncbi:UNVERIFIED_CONTAM: hypothetical protein Sangu_1274700 [Sesamum angustifolium]|uniref:Ribosomal protein L34e superfamily protein n=1 Tax=Sesamum angustifolium TaxID=2727405 RepID=A0AAW2NKF4_9LAMI